MSLTELEQEQIGTLIRQTIRSIDVLTVQCYCIQLGMEEVFEIIGDVVIIALELGQADDVNHIAQNVLMNWYMQVQVRYANKHLVN